MILKSSSRRHGKLSPCHPQNKVLLEVKANYLKAIAPTLVLTETVDNEEPAPTSTPTTDKADETGPMYEGYGGQAVDSNFD